MFDHKAAGRLKPHFNLSKPERLSTSSSVIGSDASTVLYKLAERVALNWVATLRTNTSMSFEVAKKDEGDAQSSTFSQNWTPLQATVHLSSGPIPFVSESYLVASD